MRKLVFCIALLLAFGAREANASTISLNCPSGMQNESSNSSITFGGSGIPKDAVCIGQFGDVTLAITAHQRFDNPPLTNDGIDTYFAGIGNDAANGQSEYGIWNFGYYAYNSVAAEKGGPSYFLDLSWEVNPTGPTDSSEFGHLVQQLAPGGTLQDSWNLGMNFIDQGSATVPIPGFYSPASGFFNPNIAGQYQFVANISTPFGGESLGYLSAEVNVGEQPAPVPEPASMMLLGTGLLTLGARMRRKKQSATQ